MAVALGFLGKAHRIEFFRIGQISGMWWVNIGLMPTLMPAGIA